MLCPEIETPWMVELLWKLRVDSDVKQTPAPNEQELRAIREYDKEGFWTK